MAAAVPAAWPKTAQVAMTRVLPKATWLALILRPAMKRLLTFLLYSERSGMLYTSFGCTDVFGGRSGRSNPPGG